MNTTCPHCTESFPEWGNPSKRDRLECPFCEKMFEVWKGRELQPPIIKTRGMAQPIKKKTESNQALIPLWIIAVCIASITAFGSITLIMFCVAQERAEREQRKAMEEIDKIMKPMVDETINAANRAAKESEKLKENLEELMKNWEGINQTIRPSQWMGSPINP
jgi:hypothetical protein